MATIIARQFGTDLSNVRGSSQAPSKVYVAKKAEPKEREAPKEVVVAVHRESTEDTVVTNLAARRYDREFLLSFQAKFTAKPENLLEEVSRDKVRLTRPSVPRVAQPLRSFTRAAPIDKGLRLKRPSPAGGAVVAPVVQESTHVGPKEAVAPEQPQAGTAVQEISATTIRLEWKPKEKKTKPVKPKETDVRRLAARQKQIEIGKNTIGYKRFVELAEGNKKGCPKTPDKNQLCSKRSWDGQVRKWRRELHAYDPEGEEGQGVSSSEEETEDGTNGKAQQPKRSAVAMNLNKVFMSSAEAVLV